MPRVMHKDQHDQSNGCGRNHCSEELNKKVWSTYQQPHKQGPHQNAMAGGGERWQRRRDLNIGSQEFS